MTTLLGEAAETAESHDTRLDTLARRVAALQRDFDTLAPLAARLGAGSPMYPPLTNPTELTLVEITRALGSGWIQGMRLYDNGNAIVEEDEDTAPLNLSLAPWIFTVNLGERGMAWYMGESEVTGDPFYLVVWIEGVAKIAITGSTPLGGAGSNRWSYTASLQRPLADGRYESVGSSMTAYNDCEAFNTSDPSIRGNGVDSGTDYPDGFTLRPIRGNPVVEAHRVIVPDGGGGYTVEWRFNQVNVDQGPCL